MKQDNRNDRNDQRKDLAMDLPSQYEALAKKYKAQNRQRDIRELAEKRAKKMKDILFFIAFLFVVIIGFKIIL